MFFFVSLSCLPVPVADGPLYELGAVVKVPVDVRLGEVGTPAREKEQKKNPLIWGKMQTY